MLWHSEPSGVKTGAAAGRRVRQILLQSKKPLTWTPSFKRTCIRRPIVEIAHLIGHRLAHNDFEEVRELLVSQNRAEVCRRIAKCRARPFQKALFYYVIRQALRPLSLPFFEKIAVVPPVFGGTRLVASAVECGGS